MLHSRTLRVVTLAAAILALSASAAQARPLGLGYTDHSQSQAGGISAGGISVIRSAQSQHHGFQGGPARTLQSGRQAISPAETPLHGYQGPARPYYAGPQVMSSAVDSPNAQQLPVGVTRTQAVVASDTGFNWTSILLGAGIVTALMLCAGAATRHVKPGEVAQA